MKRRYVALLMSVVMFFSFLFNFEFVKADVIEPTNTYEGWLSDLLELAREDCPTNQLTEFDYKAGQLENYFSSSLIIVMHHVSSHTWYFVAYTPQTNNRTLRFWYTYPQYNKLQPRYNQDYYDYNFYCYCGFKIYNGGGYSLLSSGTSSGLGNTSFNGPTWYVNSSWTWNYPNATDMNTDNIEVYSNQSIRLNNGGAWNQDSSFDIYVEANLFEGHYVPPILDFDVFKFNLGDRWYITSTDQDFVLELMPGGAYDYYWTFSKIDSEGETIGNLILSHTDMQFVPYAQDFISVTVTNIHENGIYAYDITDMIQDGTVYGLYNSRIVYDLNGQFAIMAESEDYIWLELTPSEENQSQDQAWTIINNYIINYPSVTISPQQLAEQVTGHRAFTGSMGIIQIPSGVYQWCIDNEPNEIEHGAFGADGYWHYKFDASSGNPNFDTMINWSLCNACIIPAPNPNWLTNYLGIDSYSFPVWYWNPSDQAISDAYYIGDYTIEMIYDSFDIIIFAPSDAVYLSNMDDLVTDGGSYGFTNLEYDSTIPSVANGGTTHNVFIVSTDKVLMKSQLYAMCDGINKFYDLASQYVNKRDLWDSSFFEWTMSLYWQINSLDGRLSSIYNLIHGWHLNDYFQNVLDKLDSLVNNTNEPEFNIWLLPVYNYIKQFVPSLTGFSNWIDSIEEFDSNLPALPDITVPALPTLGVQNVNLS